MLKENVIADPNLVIRKNSHFVSSAIHIKIGSIVITHEGESIMKNTQKKKGRKKFIALAAVGVAAAVGGVALYGSAQGNGKEDSDKKKVSTVKVEKTDLKQKVTVSGTVESAEKSDVTSDITGVKVKAVKVKKGDRVKKGDIIAELDDTDLKAQLTQAEKSLENAKALSTINLNAAQRGYDDTVADKDTGSARGSKGIDEAQGEYDKAVGDRNTAYDTYNNAVEERAAAENAAAEAAQSAADAAAPVEEMKAAVKEAKKAAETASEEFDRLAMNESTTSEELDTAKKTRDDARNAYEDAAAALEDAQEGLRALNDYANLCAQQTSSALVREKELYAGLSSADRLVDQARLAAENAADAKSDTDRQYEKAIAQSKDTLDTAKLNVDDSLSAPQKLIDDINDNIEKCVVRADCDGVVTDVSFEEGDTYTGGAIAVIQDDSSFKVTASVDQYDIFKIAGDMPAEITVQAIGSDALDGKLSFVSPTPAPAALTPDGASSAAGYPIEATFDGAQEDLRIGMSAKLVIITEERNSVFAVPDSCILKDDKGWYVKVQGEGTEIENIYVEKGLETDYYTEISGSKITDGMEVIQPESDDKDAGSLFY